MCAGLVAQSTELSGFTGSLDAMHSYSRAEVAAAAYAAYQSIYDTVRDEIRDMSGSWATDANCERQLSRGIAQQMINCFLEDGTCNNMSDDNVDAATEYVTYGTGSWNYTGLSISTDNLIDNGVNNGYFRSTVVDPDADSGWGWYPTGYGTCI
jgi:hypothetical protein